MDVFDMNAPEVSAAEIEVTAAMIEAGAFVLLRHDPCVPPGWEAIVRDIFEAMLLARSPQAS